MSVKAGDKGTGKAAPLTAIEVADYLAGHPDFLIHNPDLIEVLSPPGRFDKVDRDGVVDLQRFMVDRLQGELARLGDSQHELIAATRSNLSSQVQVHRAVLTLLEATSFEHLIHLITHELAQILDVDAVTLSVESETAPPALRTSGVFVLSAGCIDHLLGEGRDVLLRDRAEGMDRIFGPAAALVRSDALIRLGLGARAPAVLLAIGSREETRFHPGQGTELLGFLAGVLARLIRGWLNLPAK